MSLNSIRRAEKAATSRLQIVANPSKTEQPHTLTPCHPPPKLGVRIMDAGSSSDVFLFEEYRFDPRRGLSCTKNGELRQVSLGSRALAVLAVLVERAGDVVSKDEVMRAVWPGVTVEDANLTMQISSLRRALDAGRTGSSCILTVPGRGYRFIPEVARVTHAKEAQFDPAASPPAAPARPEERLPQPEPPGSPTPFARVRRSSIGAMVAGGLLIVAILASGGWWMLHNKGPPPTVSAVAPTASRPEAHSPQDRRLTVIVLPFENSSGDPRQDDLAAGITRDLTDLIARAAVRVIPAATAARYRGKTVNLQTLGRDHNVHFAITGNARRQDGRLIVSATLYETDSDKTLWSQRFDRPDNSDEWNGVIAQIWNHCAQAETDAEVERAMREHPDDLDKRDFMLAYRSSSLGPDSKENDLKSIALIERALALDPDYVDALVEKANMYAALVDQGYSSDPSADLSTARKAVDRALQFASDNIWAWKRKARILQDQGDLEGAAALIRKVLEREPLDGYRHLSLGTIQMKQGHFKEALESLTTAKRLGGSPPSPLFGQGLALGLLANDRFSEAIAEAQQARAGWETQGDVGRASEGAWLALIAAESESGQDAEARADLHKFLATPRTYRTLAEVQQFPQFAANRKLLDGLQRAGMPAE
jgi:DNA-binding winged helix-turn-helix (wHTH) protein/TolB-like protein